MDWKTLTAMLKARICKHTAQTEYNPSSKASQSVTSQSETSTTKLHFDADRPISNDSQDRLGFRVIAENLAQSVLSHSTDEGLVIGLEGSWGSGKSSILNLLRSHVEKKHKDVSIIPFEPWIIGNRDDMVASLITSIASEIEKLELQSKSENAVDNVGSLSKTLRKYGAKAGRGLSPLAKIASVFNITGAAAAEKILDALKECDVSEAKTSVSELKAELVEGLLNSLSVFSINQNMLAPLIKNKTASRLLWKPRS